MNAWTARLAMNAWSLRLTLIVLSAAVGVALVAVRVALAAVPVADESHRVARPHQAGPDPATIDVRYETLLSTELTRAVYVTHAGDGSGRLFIVEKNGRIRIYQGGALRGSLFLDITDRVESAANERGLLGLAFHPSYTQNGYFYVGYTKKPSGDLVYSRFKVSPDDPNKALADSEKLVITWPHPRGNHNGGNVVFGPDGYLYLGTGDGGGGGDPDKAGQNKGVFLGKILRIDVDTEDAPYKVPSTNPFVDDPRAKPEVWDFGLRNPWRYSFDRETGDLYIADVGQGQWEEVNFEPAAGKGGFNYGWSVMEGAHCYGSGTCNQDGMTLPIFEYDHGQGISITGGHVYRGSRYPNLVGAYFAADYQSRTTWAISRDAGGRWRNAKVGTAPVNVNSFGEGEDGEIYLVGDRGLYHLADADAPTATRGPATSTATPAPPTASPTLRPSTPTPLLPTATPTDRQDTPTPPSPGPTQSPTAIPGGLRFKLSLPWLARNAP